jgi:cell division transport system permease protein
MRSLNYFLKEAITNLVRNSLMTITTIITLFVSLIFLGGFILLIINLNNLTNIFPSRVEIMVYLRDDLNEDEILRLKNKIVNFEDVKEIKYISKDEALNILQLEMKEQIDLKDILSHNPLPDTLQVKVKTPEKVKEIAEKIKNYPEVEEVVFAEGILSSLIKIKNVIKIYGIILISIFFIGSYLLITNTIKMTVFFRRKEIKIMQLVGATDWFIRCPFIIEGFLQGLIGGIFSGVVVGISYWYSWIYLKDTLPFIPIIFDFTMLLEVSGILICIGIFFGIIGGIFTVSKILVES